MCRTLRSRTVSTSSMLSTTDIYRWLDGSEFMGERLVVQFARGSTRPRDGPGFGQERMAPRPRRTVHRMTITGLPFETSWQVRILPGLHELLGNLHPSYCRWHYTHILTPHPRISRTSLASPDLTSSTAKSTVSAIPPALVARASSSTRPRLISSLL